MIAASARTDKQLPDATIGSLAEQRRTGQASSTAAHTSTSVSAADARGIQITHLQYITTRARTRKQLQLVVTLEDNAGRLVRGAIVLVRPRLQSKQTITTRLASFSNPLGQAQLIIPLTAQSLGKQLDFLVSVRTPNAHALEIGSVRLPARTSRA